MIKLEKSLKFLSWFLFIVVVFLHGVSLYFSLYWKLQGFDKFMHLLGGMWLGCLAMWYVNFYKKLDLLRFDNFFQIMAATGAAALGGVLWEGFEFVLDAYLNTISRYVDFMQPNILDTMGDLVFDLWGGLIAGVILIILFKKLNKEDYI